MSRLLTAEDFVHLDIPAVVEQHTSTRLHPGRTQYSGACPYEDCDRDTNGFMVWPELTSRNCHYNCRGCRRAGDIVKLLRDIKGLSFQEVCDLLEIGQGKPAIVRRQPSPNEWQRKEREFLAGIYRYSQRGLQHARAQAYLAQRGIPLSVALEYGLCYIPPYKEMDAQTQDNLFHIRLWTDRLIFPLSDGGFTGRALTFWEPGMDEEQHKQILDDFQKRTEAYNKKAERKQQKPVITRWKTTATSAIAAGRNGIRCDDIPVNVLSATLAYDGDASGQEAARRDEKTFRRKGIRTIRCTPSEDDQIKDWSARYRLQGKAGLLHLRTVLQEQGILLCSVCGRDATATDEIFFFDEHGCAFCPVHWSGEMGRQELPPSDAMISLCRDTQDQTILPVSLLETPMEGHEVTVTPQIIGGLPGEPEPVVEPSSFEGSYQTVEQVLALTHRFPDTEQLVLDLETTGLDPRTSKVITLAIGKPGNVAIIDLRGYYTSDPGQQEAWKDALQQLLHRDVLWMGHNLKFDWSFLAQQFEVRLGRVYDTMLVERLLHAGGHVSASLQASAERYGMTVTKEQRSWFIDLDRRLAEWAAPLPVEQLTYIRQDIEVPYQIWERQQETIAQQDLARVVSLEHQTLPVIAAMELHGVCIDVERWRGILSARRAQKATLEAQIKQILGEALARTQPAQATLFGEPVLPCVHLTSSDQLREALHALGVNVSSASKEALQEVQQQHTVIPLLLEWKALEKFETAFGENLLNYVTTGGRIHATFDQLGAASGRVICREPNLQQIPRPMAKDDPYDLRRCFVAPEGYRLLIADLSNIELRILAEVSADSTMLRFFADGKDLHSETARLMFKLPADVNPKVHLVNGRKARDIAKTINFGLAYGMGAQGLANRVGVDLEIAKALMGTYFATYRAVSKYLTRSGKEGLARGYAMSLSGRRRFFSTEEIKVRRGEAERSAKNHPIQGTNADILKRALARLYERLPATVSIVLTVHDEIVLECPEALVEDATQVLKEAMVQACREYLKVVRIPEPDVLDESYWAKG